MGRARRGEATSGAVVLESLDVGPDAPAWEVPEGTPDGRTREGEEGRARREGPVTAGEAGRGIPPMPLNRELGLGTPEARREAGPGVEDVGGAETALSGVSPLLGPATRRNRSSSCVLSLGDKGPT